MCTPHTYGVLFKGAARPNGDHCLAEGAEIQASPLAAAQGRRCQAPAALPGRPSAAPGGHTHTKQEACDVMHLSVLCTHTALGGSSVSNWALCWTKIAVLSENSPERRTCCAPGSHSH